MLVLYKTVGRSVARYFFWRFNAQVLGIENVPRSCAVLFVGNHQSNFDGVLVLGSIARRVRIMIKSDGEDPRALLLMKVFADMFTVTRNSRDLTAMRKAQSVLQNGGAICMFPEGHRSVEVIGFHSGVATIARKIDGLKIVPFGITHSNISIGGALRNLGITQLQPELKPTIVFGPAFELPPATSFSTSKDQRVADTVYIRQQVLDLLPKDLEGEDRLYVVEH